MATNYRQRRGAQKRRHRAESGPTVSTGSLYTGCSGSLSLLSVSTLLVEIGLSLVPLEMCVSRRAGWADGQAAGLGPLSVAVKQMLGTHARSCCGAPRWTGCGGDLSRSQPFFPAFAGRSLSLWQRETVMTAEQFLMRSGLKYCYSEYSRHLLPATTRLV